MTFNVAAIFRGLSLHLSCLDNYSAWLSMYSSHLRDLCQIVEVTHHTQPRRTVGAHSVSSHVSWQLATTLIDANHNFIHQAAGLGIVPILVCVQQVIAATAISNHCFMTASFQEQLGSKLAVLWHHG